MMKKFKLLSYTFSILGLILTSCDPSVEAPGVLDASQVTYLPLITLSGDLNQVLDCNATSYTDPGAVASAGGSEIELFTDVSATYFGGSTINGPDTYSISYSAYNSDGIAASAFRSVFWPPCTGDLVTSIAGVYTTTALNRTPGYSTGDLGPILIRDMGNGVYGISDIIGGWYEYEYGYGSDYAAKGCTIKANDIPSNNFTLNVTSSTLPWGGRVYLTKFTVDAATKTISMETQWEGYSYVWKTTLTQM